MERGAVIGIGDHLADVVGGEHAMNAGNLFAALVSIDLIRPCATVLRKIFPCSIPGSRMV